MTAYAWGGGGGFHGLAVNPPPVGNNFYVKTGGNDLLDGRSSTNAWETITKVNAASATFVPGTTVLFNRGNTWTDVRLTAGVSGTAALPITYAAYGAGAKPIIDGGTATGGFITLGKDYLTLQNIEFRHGTGSNVGLYAHHILMEDCVVHGGADYNIACDGLAATVNNITIRRCTVDGAIGESGIFFGRTAGAGGAQYGLIEDCSIHDNGNTATQDHGIYFGYAAHVIARRNLVYDNYAHGIQAQDGIQDCVIDSNTVYGHGNQGIFLGGLTHWVNDGTSKVINNLIYNNTEEGIYIGANVDGVLISHNTVVENGDYQIYMMDAGPTGNIISNNILLADFAVLGDSREVVAIATDTERTANTWANNNYAYLGHTEKLRRGNPFGLFTLADWKALGVGFDANSISADPVFVTDYTDLHIDDGSPCIGAGVAVAGITIDRDGVAYVPPSSIGCYEHV